MKFFKSFSVLLLVITNGIYAQYEDEPCMTKGESGTCKKLQDCPSALEQVRVLRRHDKQRCGFVGADEIVCCNEIPNNGSSKEDGDSIWDINDPGPAKNKDSVVISPTVSRKAERKSEIVCEEYSNEVPLRLDFHILGGEDALLGEFPHMCALGYNTDDGITWQCGGSLISDRYVLTAAHCIINPDGLRPVRVRMGIVALNGGKAGDEKNPAPEEFNIENITVHSSFIRRTSTNDIALIRLDRQVKYNNNIHPACLYTKTDDPNGLLVTGWGYIDNQGSERSNILQKALLRPVPMDKCNATYIKRLRRLTTSQLCAGSVDGNQDSCRGDSGGPLQVFTKENVYAIVGVISFGIGCGGNVPAVYTRVGSYLDWIEPIVWPGA